MQSDLPVAVIGAGPVGLAAAAHLVAKGEAPVVFEVGDSAGASILEWGHVQLFSPWRYSVDAAARALLERDGWRAPDPETFPTGRELVERYLVPLSQLPEIAPHLRLGTTVVSLTRQGYDKMKSAAREDAPFVLHVRSASDGEEHVFARAVIDASGTWTRPNPLGASGVPALGETALAERIYYGIPDVLGAQRGRYAGRRVLVVGSGHSAFNALLDLAELAEQAPGTEIVWAFRRSTLANLFGGGQNDALPARGLLGTKLRQTVDAGLLQVVPGFKVAKLERSGDRVVVASDDATLPPVDEIVAATGFRPDLAPLRELRLELDPAVESPVALAPLIDPNVHSCGTVRPHGAEQLAHPERDFYVAGMKSYGRAPTFLMLTGYEQVRSIVCALTGDVEGARDVRLELPKTGVCSLDARESDAASDGEPAAAAPCCGATRPASLSAAAPRQTVLAT
ncbi:MAG: NAD(P)-binding domain-containing protein [Chloroflexi bacterium]|nr:NAD(P)-binding domain-containing protein [Chloroflexota bacterium]